MTYNNFGLTYQDILQAFSNSIESDFATADQCGQKIINDEIDLQEGELLSNLSEASLGYLNELPVHEVTTVTLSGQSAFVFDFIPDFDKDIRVQVVAKCNDSLILFECFDGCLTGETISYWFDETTGKYYGILDTKIVNNDEKILISYSVDKSVLVLPSLKLLLRDMVACSLGSVLYSDGDSTWAAVTRYCAMADKKLDKMAGWVPPEFRALKFIEWNGPFRAVRNNRL